MTRYESYGKYSTTTEDALFQGSKLQALLLCFDNTVEQKPLMYIVGSEIEEQKQEHVTQGLPSPNPTTPPCPLFLGLVIGALAME